jgi:hypothetical protein
MPYTAGERRWRLLLTAALALYGWRWGHSWCDGASLMAQELPLVGGGEHDWAILLDQFGWLELDHALGGASSPGS